MNLMSISEDTYDEINAELRRLAQIMEEEAVPAKIAHSALNTQGFKVFIGTGDDCTIVLFGNNYKPLEVHV